MNVKFIYGRYRLDHRELAYEILDFIPRVGEYIILDDGDAWKVSRVTYNLKIMNGVGGDQVIIELEK